MLSVSATSEDTMRQTAPVPTCIDSHGTKCVRLRCPKCAGHLATMAYQALAQVHEPIKCRQCLARFMQQQQIWLALPENRRRYYERFIRDYQIVRKLEGRGSEDPRFYLSLPYRDRTKRHSEQWAIRARTYEYIEGKILRALKGTPLAVLDLGAGNGWLSYRLATLGHRPIAVDLQTNVFDGLGAAVHYRHVLPMLFPRFQAELDRLPFETGQFDCVIFNASFHYSENYDATLSEAIRCLRPGGTILIADSPCYQREESGRQMAKERRLLFQETFGFPSDGLASCEYITKDRLLALGARYRLQWKTHKVWYGFRWACRPLMAKFQGRREPSKFCIYTAEVR